VANSKFGIEFLDQLVIIVNASHGRGAFSILRVTISVGSIRRLETQCLRMSASDLEVNAFGR
jgi:hypothetical protein